MHGFVCLPLRKGLLFERLEGLLPLRVQCAREIGSPSILGERRHPEREHHPARGVVFLHSLKEITVSTMSVPGFRSVGALLGGAATPDRNSVQIPVECVLLRSPLRRASVFRCNPFDSLDSGNFPRRGVPS
jgi:hypothetical protein